ncbi:MAG: hypothetical protein IJW55_08125 [Clostridia bacterium]|nr:hypothetical protein [Clostridia bacterium]
MKKLKNIILYWITLCVVFVSFGTVFSASAEAVELETDADGNIVGGSLDISVMATAVSKPVFTVSIPAEIPIGEITRTEGSDVVSKNFNVVFEGITYLNGKSIDLTITAPNNQFLLYCGEATLPYEVYQSNGTKFESGNVFATVTADQTVTGTVKVDQQDIAVAGEYAGKLTFTVSVEEAQ